MIYFSLTWLTISKKLHQTLSPVTLSVIATRSPARTFSYSASLLKAKRPRVKDCSMIDNSGVVRTIPMPGPILFEAPSIFRIYPFSMSHCSVAHVVKSVIKSAMTCPLIVVLFSYLSPYGLSSDAHFNIRLIASGFSLTLRRVCSVRTMIRKGWK